MPRTQAILLATFVVLVTFMLGRATWGVLAPLTVEAPAALASVPAWAWWTAFGVAMSLGCRRSSGCARGRCGSAAGSP